MYDEEPVTGLEPGEPCVCPHCRTEGLAEQWGTFSDDRRYGRVRELLAAEGVRIG